MAASENGANTSAEIEIEALISEVDDKEVSEVVSSIQKELDVGGDASVSLDTMEETSKPFPDHNGTQDLTQDSINLTKPIKTEGQSSTSLHTTSPGQSLTSDGVPPTSTKPSSLQLDGLGLNNASARTPFALSPFSAGQFPSLLQLSTEEQSALQRQAGLLAVSATTKSTGEIGKAKEILTVVSKVKEFLTHLIQLAGNSGPQVKSAVQALVQKLVVSYVAVNGSCTILALIGCHNNRGGICSADTGRSQVKASARPATFPAGEHEDAMYCRSILSYNKLCFNLHREVCHTYAYTFICNNIF